MMNEEAINAILRYTDDSLIEPHGGRPELYFKYASYSRWAANEILNRLMDNPTRDPDDILEGFILEMYYYTSFLDESSDACFIFTTAKYAAEDIREYLQGLKGEPL